MNRFDRFADILNALLARTRWTTVKLAEKSHVSRATIENWLRGRSTGPRDWQQVAQIAAAFELDLAEASLFFESAGHPPISDLLRSQLLAADRALLARWGSLDLVTSSMETRTLTPACMPTVRVEPITPFAPWSHMYLLRNPFFVGHQGLLLSITRILNGKDQVHGQSFNTVVLTGIGGSGKSQIASEWVHRYGQYYPGGVFWIDCTDPDHIRERIAEAGRHTFPELRASFETLPVDERVRLVWNSWHDGTPRLLILDGCEDEALLDQLRPNNSATSVIVTSRRAKWRPFLNVRELVVPMLSRRESIELLQRYLPQHTEKTEELDAIAQIVGDLPFALHLAGLYLDHYAGAISPTVYRKQVCALSNNTKRTVLDHPSMQRSGLSPTRHEQHLRMTFEHAYQQLDETSARDSLALTILAHAAAFVPKQQIPHHLLRQNVLPDAAPDDDILLAFEDALRQVLDLGLLQITDDRTILMHPLIAQYVNASTLIVTPPRS